MPRKHRKAGARLEPLMRLQALDGQDVELLIYGDIGESWNAESVAAQEVALALNDLPDNVATINVRINSYGGSVADGLAIYNALRRHPARKAVTVDGVAMSIASLIAMAGDTVAMPSTSIMMIHAPWGVVAGNARDARDYADTLDTFAEAMADAYVKKSGKARADVLALLRDGADHYYTAADAVAEGFADEIADTADSDAETDEYAAAYATAMLARAAADGMPAHYTGLVAAAARRCAPLTLPAPQAGGHTTPAEAGRNTHGAETMSAEQQKVARAARRQTIRAQFAPFLARGDLDRDAIQRELDAVLDDEEMTPEAAGQRLLAMLGSDTTPTFRARLDGMPHVSGGEPAGGDFAAAATDAVVLQAGISIDKPHAGARDIAGLGLHGIIRACAQRAGRNGAMSIGEAIRAALSTSDFPAILENALGKVLRRGYEAEPFTAAAWTRLVMVPDFKEQSRAILGSAPDLALVLEGAEYTHGALEDEKAVYAVAKYGKIIRLTWEALVNDDLGAFLRTTQAMGIAAARAEADKVYASFALNAGAGQTMQDGKTLFHADHKNLATASTALDAAALAKGRILLRRQTALGGGAMNLPPRFLLVAPEHEQAAEVLLAAAARSLSQGSDNELTPPWLANLQLVVEARLADSAVYLLTSPDTVDTLERAWLEADGGPVVKEEDGFGTDTRDYKVRHVFAARWLDWRGAVKLPISAGVGD